MTSRVRTPPSKVLTFSWRVVFFYEYGWPYLEPNKHEAWPPFPWRPWKARKASTRNPRKVWGVSPKMRGCVFTNKLGASLTLETQPPSYCKIQQLLWEWNNCSKIEKKSGTIFPSYKPLKTWVVPETRCPLFLFVFSGRLGLERAEHVATTNNFPSIRVDIPSPQNASLNLRGIRKKSEGFSVELKDQCCTMLPFFHWFEKG